MRSVILSTLLLVLAVCTVSAQNRNKSICRLGFTYDISQSKNWGNNKPVIKSVIPYSSAEHGMLLCILTGGNIDLAVVQLCVS